MKDSLWSVDLFRCESITLKTDWVLVLMGQFTRRIIGFGIHAGDVDETALCRIFNHAIAGQGIPSYLGSDDDPLFEFHRWKANLRILEVDEVKTVSFTPTSHPFVERPIGTIRREYLDNVFFWNTVDLEKKLAEFSAYYNQHRVLSFLDGQTPGKVSWKRVNARTGAPPFPLADPLPWAIRDAGGRLIINSPRTGSTNRIMSFIDIIRHRS